MLAIALPMTLSHVTTPLLGLVDATVIGRLGEAHLLGAVALGAVVFDFLFWSFGALRMGTAGLTAQAVGAGDRAEIDRALARALAVGVAAGLVLVALQWPIRLVAFSLSGASPAVLGALAVYFGIRIWAAPLTLANYAAFGSIVGRGRTDLGFLVQVGINLANIALTLLFVAGLGMGVAGAALGTVLAEALGLAFSLAVLGRLGSRPWRVPLAEVMRRDALVRTLAVNRDIMIRTVALLAAFAIFTGVGARSGDVTLAANAVLYNMFLMGGYFLDGFATAAETLCGQAIGARREDAFRRAVALSLGWSVGFGAALSGVFLVGGAPFVDAVSTNPEVRALARDYLVFAALTPLVGAAAFAYDGIYIGATWTAAMRDLMLLSLALFAGVLWLSSQWGNAALWGAFVVFLGVRGFGQAARYPGLVRRTFPQGVSARS
ncbi:MATE family efflux transporter [Salinarimonas soli]|nr:MATE family efflux transporter [Salinarimonas soli]